MLSVLKIGGSVLRDDASYAATARFLQARLSRREDDKLVVIVSAQYGQTDAMLAEAQAIHGDVQRAGRREPPSSAGSSELSKAALDLLWCTGELRSVALLSLHLQALGVPAVPFNVHQTGLVACPEQSRGACPEQSRGACPEQSRGACPDRAGTTVRPLRLLAALASSRIVIVPGFLGVSPGGAITSLGRGGSDLTAVLLAAAVRADACELIKDVPGYFTADPHRDAGARPIHDLSIAEALAMADAGCDLVQRAALSAAAAANLHIVIRSMDAAAPVTHLRSQHHGIRHEDDPRRAAIGA